MSQIFRTFVDMKHLAMAVGFTTGLLGSAPHAPSTPNAEEVMLVSRHRERRARRRARRILAWRRLPSGHARIFPGQIP
jgi:hypothetical protein